jgi:cytoskeletal protein RodZ
VSEPIPVEIDPEHQHPVLQPRKGGLFRFLTLTVVLAVVGLAAGYVWLNYGIVLNPPSGTAPTSNLSPEESASLKELRSTQQRSATSIEALRKDVGDQQLEFKRLSEQISIMASKIEELQRAGAEVKPAPVATPVATPRPKATTVAKRKPATPSGISVGGAPLPPPAESNVR